MRRRLESSDGPVRWIETTAANDWHVQPEELEQLCETDPERPRLLSIRSCRRVNAGTRQTATPPSRRLPGSLSWLRFPDSPTCVEA